jgi:tetratricopeptide (TPR) repeat protein
MKADNFFLKKINNKYIVFIVLILILIFKFFFYSKLFCDELFVENISTNIINESPIKNQYQDTGLGFYFEQANKCYENNEYEKSLEIYLSLYSQRWISADLLYNISNTYFKLGKMGHALAFIEKAKKIAPRNSDINYNRKFIYNKLGEEEDIVKDFVNFFTQKELIYAFLILNFLFWTILTILTNNYNKNWKIINYLIFSKNILLLFIIIFVVWLIIFSSVNNKKEAIAVIPDVPVFASPTKDSQAIFTVPETKNVLVKEKRNGWIKVCIKDEKLEGWAKKENFEVV